jgi:hypothetical protein
LESLTAWWPKGARAWAYAPTFDCAILINAYKQLGLKQPWHYRDEMDARTLKNITPKFGQEEVTEALRLAGRVNQWIEHYALHDAMSQALGVALSLQWLKENRW